MNAGDAQKHYQAPNIAGDTLNIALLIFLFTLQSIPRGMAMGISLILQSRNISWPEQAEFSCVQYPYCLKLLWAPIVDCFYSKKFGRRKTWAVPVQYLLGASLFVISMNVNDWLGTATRKPDVRLLSVTFFLSIILCATLEITFDGWALTMLKKRNVGHAGTCNNTGYVLSLFFGFVVFIILDSKDFANKFRAVPQDRGLVNLADFTCFWSVLCVVSSTLIMLFKKDTSLDAIEDNYECRLTLKESYKRLWKITKITPIRTLCFILITYQIGIGPSNGVARLKLMDVGIPKDTFALLTLPSLPIMMAMPFVPVLSRYLTGQRSMRAFVVIYFLKLILSLAYGVFIFCTRYAKEPIATWQYLLLLLIYNADTVADHLMYVTVFSFFSRISDPRFGGMYTALLHAASNVGYRWPISFCLSIMDLLTIRWCHEEKTCTVVLDGYFTETILFFLVGIAWLCSFKRTIYKLEDMDTSVWIVKSKSLTPIENRQLLVES